MIEGYYCACAARQVNHSRPRARPKKEEIKLAVNRTIRVAAFLLLALSVLPGPCFAAATSRPNFVIIFADDLGYGDLGCFGSNTIRTPRIDRMAREGARLTDFYAAAPFCSPSRASILTGRYPVRAGVPNVLFPTERTGLPPSEITIAELLSKAGYATACIGKWHLGYPLEFCAQRQGFDFFLGLPYSNDMSSLGARRCLPRTTRIH